MVGTNQQRDKDFQELNIYSWFVQQKILPVLHPLGETKVPLRLCTCTRWALTTLGTFPIFPLCLPSASRVQVPPAHGEKALEKPAGSSAGEKARVDEKNIQKPCHAHCRLQIQISGNYSSSCTWHFRIFIFCMTVAQRSQRGEV